MTTRASLKVLAIPQFRLYFLARTAAILGTTATPVALTFGVLHISSSPAALGVVLAAEIVPQVVLLFVTGTLGDRINRVRLMVLANVLAAASQGLTALLLLTGTANIPSMAALAAITGAAVALFAPASQGAMVQLVPADSLRQANALMRLSMNIMRVLGPSLGAAAVALSTPGWAIAAEAVTFALSALLIGRLQVALPAREPSTFTADLRHGWNDFWSRRWLWVIVVQYSLVNIAWLGGVQVLGPVITEQRTGGAGTYGLMMSALALGLIAGAVMMISLRSSRPLLLACFGTLVHATPLMCLALGAPAIVLIASAFVAGVGIELFIVSFTTVMQEQVPAEMMGRVSSYDMLFGMALAPLGLIAAGPLANTVGVAPTLWGAAALITGSTVAVIAVREVRQMAPRGSGDDDSSRKLTAISG